MIFKISLCPYSIVPSILQVSSSTLACLAFPTPSHALQTALCDSASLLLPHNASSWVSPFLLREFRPKLSLVFPGLPPSQHITIILIPSSVPSNLVGYKVFIPHDHLSKFYLLLKVWFKCHLTNLTVPPLSVLWWCSIYATSTVESTS